MSSGPIWYSVGGEALAAGAGAAGAGARADAGSGAVGAGAAVVAAVSGAGAAAGADAAPPTVFTFATPSKPSGLCAERAEYTVTSPSLTASATPRPDEQFLASRTIRVVISEVRPTLPSGSDASM